MSIAKNRADTLKALVAGSVACSAGAVSHSIALEIDALFDARLVRPRARRAQASSVAGQVVQRLCSFGPARVR